MEWSSSLAPPLCLIILWYCFVKVSCAFLCIICRQFQKVWNQPEGKRIGGWFKSEKINLEAGGVAQRYSNGLRTCKAFSLIPAPKKKNFSTVFSFFLWQHWGWTQCLTLAGEALLQLEPLGQPFLWWCFFEVESHELFAWV
jgi:hypothetical protein